MSPSLPQFLSRLLLHQSLLMFTLPFSPELLSTPDNPTTAQLSCSQPQLKLFSKTKCILPLTFLPSGPHLRYPCETNLGGSLIIRLYNLLCHLDLPRPPTYIPLQLMYHHQTKLPALQPPLENKRDRPPYPPPLSLKPRRNHPNATPIQSTNSRLVSSVSHHILAPFPVPRSNIF